MTQLARHPLPAESSLFPIPPATRSEVWIDFDGTITRADVLDELLKQFAVDDRWVEVEREWQAGRIGSRECLSRQLRSVRIGPKQLDGFLARIPVDPGLNTLLKTLNHFAVPVTILSDGIDRFIRQLLATAGHGELAFRSNGVDYHDDQMALRCPFGHAACVSAAAHCKCESMRTLSAGRPSAIYIGDGRSDLCPARRADCRFAKGVLAKTLSLENVPFAHFDTLADVADQLAAAWR